MKSNQHNHRTNHPLKTLAKMQRLRFYWLSAKAHYEGLVDAYTKIAELTDDEGRDDGQAGGRRIESGLRKR